MMMETRLRIPGSSSTTLSILLVSSTNESLPSTELSNARQLRLDQSWFWTKEWQTMEREADEDLAAGRYRDFDTMDEFIADLSGR